MISESTRNITIRFPELYEAQKIFGNWDTLYPDAQVLVAPSGVKVGKSYASAMWLAKNALLHPGSYNVWIGPTYLKAKIGYRYLKSFLPDIPHIHPVDGNLEIKFSNGSYIKLLHGKDAETTIEGEAIDGFVIDESGKQEKQLWYSLLTTLTQTRGRGIVTGTPRGFNWYYEVYRKAKQGDPFYVWASLKTCESPYVTKESILNAKRILPPGLFDQYYNALFVAHSTTFGDIQKMFKDEVKCDPAARFWVHPDPAARALDTVTGWDIAKHRDYSVFYTVNNRGQCVGYARFNKVPYETQVDRLKHYMHKYFTGDRSLRYDATGVGSAVGEMIVDKDIDADVTAVTFTNRSKQEMVTRTTHAIDCGWHTAPRIEQLEHEFGSFELTVTKSGLFSYSAPDGEHDDVVCAAMLAISGAYQSAQAEEADKTIDRLMGGGSDSDFDDYEEAADAFAGDDDDFFGDTTENDDDDFDFGD